MRARWLSKEAGNNVVFLFIFEGLGTSELLLILIVALVIFGPRKLPQLSRSLGKSLADFRRASEDFKQTWQKEVDRENIFKEVLVGETTIGEDRSILGENRDRTSAILAASDDVPPEYTEASSISARPDSEVIEADAGATTISNPDLPAPPKREWL